MSRDELRETHIDELCHRITTADTRGVRVWLCAELKREINALNADRLARLNDALRAAGVA